MRHTFVIDKDGKVAVTFATADLKTPRAKEEYEKALASLA
jgi:peroxiredoxin